MKIQICKLEKIESIIIVNKLKYKRQTIKLMMKMKWRAYKVWVHWKVHYQNDTQLLPKLTVQYSTTCI
jgi:hypothetical protein